MNLLSRAPSLHLTNLLYISQSKYSFSILKLKVLFSHCYVSLFLSSLLVPVFSSQTFYYTGGVQTYIPSTSCINVTLYGSVGGAGNLGGGTPGKGGMVSAILQNITPNSTLYLYVGGGDNNTTNNHNWNGGGLANDCLIGGAGGASDIRTILNDLSSRLIVAGGGMFICIFCQSV